ncbi:MAG: hypothetical protein Q4A07_09140 [Coriobacteriales bacterium]|nr:hypothetical protein [Coriobacteriales bacterium]
MRFGIYRLSALIENNELQASTYEALREFDCGYKADDVMGYLRNSAVNDDKAGRCRTYLIIDLDEIYAQTPKVRILAYFTITQHSLDITELATDESMTEALDYLLGDREVNASHIASGYLIAQFAKDKSFYQSAKGFLQFAQEIIERASGLVGGVYIVLDCNAEKLREYYQDLGFTCIGERNEANGECIYQMLKPIGQGLEAGFLGNVQKDIGL